MRKLWKAPLALGVAAAALFLSPLPASASQSATSPNSAKMTALCRLSKPELATPQVLAQPAAVAALCKQFGIAGSGAEAAVAPGAVPADSAPGNCGTAYVSVNNEDNNGFPLFKFGARSILGPIGSGSATIWWQNLSNGATGNFNRAIIPNAGSFAWAGSQNADTGRGTVFTTMTGDVFITTGYICSIDPPADTENIY
jgi:hypothetical protein